MQVNGVENREKVVLGRVDGARLKSRDASKMGAGAALRPKALRDGTVDRTLNDPHWLVCGKADQTITEGWIDYDSDSIWRALVHSERLATPNVLEVSERNEPLKASSREDVTPAHEGSLDRIVKPH